MVATHTVSSPPLDVASFSRLPRKRCVNAKPWSWKVRKPSDGLGEGWEVEGARCNFVPLGSMFLVHLPTWVVDFCWKWWQICHTWIGFVIILTGGLLHIATCPFFVGWTKLNNHHKRGEWNVEFREAHSVQTLTKMGGLAPIVPLFDHFLLQIPSLKLT